MRAHTLVSSVLKDHKESDTLFARSSLSLRFKNTVIEEEFRVTYFEDIKNHISFLNFSTSVVFSLYIAFRFFKLISLGFDYPQFPLLLGITLACFAFQITCLYFAKRYINLALGMSHLLTITLTVACYELLINDNVGVEAFDGL